MTGARVNIVRKLTVLNGSEFPHTWKSTIQAASLIIIVDLIVRVFAPTAVFPTQTALSCVRRRYSALCCPRGDLKWGNALALFAGQAEREEGQSNYWNLGTACLQRRTLCGEAVLYVYMCCNRHTPTRFWTAMFVNSSCSENRNTLVAHDSSKNKQAGDITHTANFTYIYSSSFCVLTFKLLAPRTRYGRLDLWCRKESVVQIFVSSLIVLFKDAVNC